MNNASNVARRIGKYVAWFLAILLALELLLQTAAFFIHENAWRAKTQFLTGHLRVLALGDSNTYGLYLDTRDSYPAQLEQLWNRKHPEQPIEIINLGYPGSNSFRLRANLPQMLDTFKPDVVLIMIGFNDFWTPLETPADIKDAPWQALLNHSRLYRLFYMMMRPAHPQDDIDSGERNQQGNTKDILNTVHYHDKTFSLGIAAGDMARNSKHMQDNIRTMLALLDAHHIRHFLVNYPTNHGYYPAANKKIAELVAETATPFIDINQVFDEPCRSQPTTCPDLLFYDAHATRAGNTRIATTILNALEPALLGDHTGGK